MDLDINGIKVIFPFKPYDIQIKYMSSVIQALEKKQNALLESPTGTGKTLSLLCSSLAWLEHRKFQELDSLKIGPPKSEMPAFAEDLIISDSPQNSSGSGSQKKGGKKGWKEEASLRIIYSSRTHSQLNQACNELKSCYYQFSPTVTIGSRDQLCISAEVKKLESISAKNQTCRYKVKNNLCTYHHNYERKVSELNFTGSKVYDIEDLIRFGTEHNACPYYMSKAMTDHKISLTFMPYNYVLDPSIRKTLKLKLENCVIIFDEGHNIERVCEDSMSTELKSEWLALFIKSFDNVLQTMKEIQEGTYTGTDDKDLNDLNIHDVAKVKMTICDLEVELDSLARKNPKSQKGPHPTKEIFVIMHKINLDFERCGLICSVCEKITAFVMNSPSFMTNQTIAALSAVCSFLEILMPFSSIGPDDFPQHKQDFIKNYRLYTELEQENNNFRKTWLKTTDQITGWTVYLWCMSPSVAIKSLQRCGIHNLIITSGTLSPLESFECEMGIPFHVKLQNSHVISRNQLSIQLIAKDPNGNDLCGSFEKRNDDKYYRGLGLTMIEMARIIPKGIFIFFSSYSLINRCIETWKENRGVSIWTAISCLKKIFVEPRKKDEFYDNIESFRYAIDNTPEGAIFMGVARGKLSEGIDMADDYCRAVIIIGMPYPARYDPKVVLKQQYLNDNNCRLNGTQWYMLQMKRALNQSIGRVVRHKNDYGMIVLCDSRFKQLNDGFSQWVLPFFDRNNGDVDFRYRINQIISFFSDQSKSLMAISEPKKKKNNVDINNDEDVDDDDDNFSKIKKKKQSLKQKSIKKYTSDKNNSQKPNQEESQIEKMFNAMRNNYTTVKDKASISPMASKKNNSSIFSAFKSPIQITKRKQSNNKIPSNDNFKKVRSIDSQESSPPEESKPLKTIDDNNSSYNKLLLNVDVKIAECNGYNDNDEDKSGTNNREEEFYDLNGEDVINVKVNVLKSEKNINLFNLVMNEIKDQPHRCRQFVETLTIYSKKKNSTYLALRMNFILDNTIDCKKRDLILKDFSQLIPERERKHFLKTCKVSID